MIILADRKKCTGCSACQNICPVKCIEMIPDSEGFLYPLINRNKCMDCKVCEKICPVINDCGKLPEEPQLRTFGAYALDEQIRMNSSSGGIFSLIASKILSTGGVVFGAAFDASFQVKHVCVKDKEELYKLRTSKYVQSTVGNTYAEAERFLKSGRLVLFTGTPCQIGGVKSFLRKDYENLYTIDIACHGVPSPWIWGKNLEYIQQKSTLREINFRDKSHGWRKYYVLYKFCNGDVIKNQVDDDYYMKAYLANLTIRPSCCDCLFKGVNSMADITLADFWGVERVSPEMDDNKGISLAICHNNKGEDLLRDISNNATVVEFDYDEAVAGNPMIFKSPRSPGSRELFFEYMKKHDIQQSVELFCSDKPEIIKKVQDMEDYMDVKRKKGKLFAELWRIKNRL